jgi:hypothetical protein
MERYRIRSLRLLQNSRENDAILSLSSAGRGFFSANFPRAKAKSVSIFLLDKNPRLS